MTYKCESCNGERPAARVYLSLTDGSTDSSCVEDEPILLIGHLAIALDLDPQKLYDVIQRFSEREVKREQAEQKAAAAAADGQGDAAEPGGSVFDDPEHPFHDAKDLVGDALTAGDEK